MTLDIFAQGMVSVLGIAAAWLVSGTGRYRNWGFVLGLAAEPFWFVTIIFNGQYGLVPIAAFYTYTWARGVRNHTMGRKG